jgi:hypothetical protein
MLTDFENVTFEEFEVALDVIAVLKRNIAITVVAAVKYSFDFKKIHEEIVP